MAKRKKVPFYKKPVFWIVTLLVILILLVGAVLALENWIKGLDLDIHTPDPTKTPTSQEAPEEKPTEPEEEPITPNPYTPVDFTMDEETGEMTLDASMGKAVKGIDVSVWQGNIDWKKVKDSGVEYVMIRVGGRGTDNGEIYADKNAQKNYEGAKKAGLKIGAYFFSQSITEQEAIEEAKYTLEAIEDWDVDMPVVYDWEYVDDEARSVEVDARGLTDMAKVFCDTVRNAGYEPMIYFGRSHSVDLLILEELTEYQFWLAMYSPIMDYPHRVDMWQYTETGSVPGIKGNVDMNLWFIYED